MTFDQLVNKIITDQEFMKGLQSDPKTTLEEAGVENLTAAQIAAFKNFNWGSTKNVAKEFGCLMIT